MVLNGTYSPRTSLPHAMRRLRHPAQAKRTFLTPILEGLNIVHSLLLLIRSLCRFSPAPMRSTIRPCPACRSRFRALSRPHRGHAQSLLPVSCRASRPVGSLSGLGDLDVCGHPAESVLLLGHVRVPVLAKQLWEGRLLAVRTMAASHQVSPDGLPQVHCVYSSLTDRAAYSAGRAVVQVL